MKTPHRIEWIVLPARNLQKAKEFYSKIFGWKITNYTKDFWLFDADTIHGGFDPNLNSYNDGIRFSITVDDIIETLEEIENSGGKTIKEKFEIAPGFGYCAQFKDPNGNVLELWSEK
ncbi:MAG: VOC family protein [Candidatus Cloacimonetes bacterium]|nr:VOC family protein [Candidatus Cloacimonadota bacterium]MCF7812859.1 VOC family protein [Candidatus Cloacimonadota bacterium]MCF7867071.1 VOC family protein [Candidatus Cloacimonadota bacterium]MCF7882609.1 VOC family protein [Candidatus Cloacimonadota bacterium]